MVLLGSGNGKGKGAASGATESEIPFVTEREFEAEVMRSEIPVLLEFSADWCAPCKQIAPTVENFAREMKGRVKVLKLDIDRSPAIARQLRVQSVPTFMVWSEGRPVDAQVGALGKKQMLAMVEPYLPRAEGAIKPQELAQLLPTRKVIAIDTRDKASYERAHLPGAKHLPLEEIESRLAELMMFGAMPVLYCRSGDKSKDLALKLSEQEVPCAFVEGGLLAWEAEGLPIERP